MKQAQFVNHFVYISLDLKKWNKSFGSFMGTQWKKIHIEMKDLYNISLLTVMFQKCCRFLCKMSDTPSYQNFKPKTYSTEA